MPPSPLDNAFGQSLSAWVARVTQQLKEIDQRLDQQRVATIEINQDLEKLKDTLKEEVGELKGGAKDAINEFGSKLALFSLQMANLENSVKALQGDRNKVVGFVMLSVGTALIGLVLAQKK